MRDSLRSNPPVKPDRNNPNNRAKNSLGQPLDLAVAIVSSLILFLITLLLWQGDRTAPQVTEFSWQQKQVNATDLAFTLTFNRPMDQKSVEQNLKITPSLPGRTSWAGRKMAYTLNAPVPYGNQFKVKLDNAYDRFANEVGSHRPIQPFSAKFSSPDNTFIYIGSNGTEKNRLVKINQTNNSRQILTPQNLAITDFRLYPDRQRILVGAAPYQDQNINVLEQQIYSIQIEQENDKNPQMQLILDSKNYQNFKFELSTDGNTIVIQRLSRKQVGQYGLWVIQSGNPARPLENKPGGDFLITPDGTSVAIAQGEGVAILPLSPSQISLKTNGNPSTSSQSELLSETKSEIKSEPLDFLPKFGMVLDFSQDGSQAAMVKFNKDYTRSLFFVTNQGVQKELLKISGSILSAVFDPQKQILYALLTDADLDAAVFQEQPFLAAIAIPSGKLTRILDLKAQRNIQISLSPDGKKMLVSSTPIPDKKLEKKPEIVTESNSERNSKKSFGELSENKKEESIEKENSQNRLESERVRPLPQLFEINLANNFFGDSDPTSQTINQPPIQIKSLALSGDRPQWLP
jgi:WD40-like Beta Propeller Repeat